MKRAFVPAALALCASLAFAEEAVVDPVVPALEILGFDILVNRVNRCCGSGREDYAVTMDSIRRNLRGPWVIDGDPFNVNQLGHPYQGSMYHGFARSAGFDYWRSAAFTFAGSAAWEIAGERTPPSRNDQVSTGIGGTFLGEALFRMANLLLEKGGGLSPFWRETVAAGISPSLAFNRRVLGIQKNGFLASNDAAYYSQLQVGFMGTAQDAQGASSGSTKNELQVDYSLDFGMPGKDGYVYRRPFDHFVFRATMSSANGFENVLTRGLLWGRDYKGGANYRGVWGLYGSYDYISPQTFRISSTALSLGTTGQWRASENVAVQGTLMGGLGYAAVSTLRGVAADRDYHYGVAPQVLVSTHVIVGDRHAFDVTLRDYFVSKVGGLARGGRDNIVRADVAYTWRLRGQHGVTLKYLWNHRNAEYPDLGDRSQTRGTVGIFYTLLGHDGFGRVDW
ncbi:DUF3943 domain-containing protein [Ramlibacter sp. PS4R-6]|uniref:DUF3943 domain-containing protein n=1 Tax=Ramlibacter sp. PS4R-6 TaxID=3133438 RepID=UPI003095106C